MKNPVRNPSTKFTGESTGERKPGIFEIPYKSITDDHVNLLTPAILGSGAIPSTTEILLGNGIYISGEGKLECRQGEYTMWSLNADGSGQFAKGGISWTYDGVLTVEAANVRGLLTAASIRVDNLVAGYLAADIGLFGRIWVGVDGAEGLELTPDGLTGYNSEHTPQFYLGTTDGKAYAGGGNVVFDAGGITIENPDNENVSLLTFTVAGVSVADVYAYSSALNITASGSIFIKNTTDRYGEIILSSQEAASGAQLIAYGLQGTASVIAGSNEYGTYQYANMLVGSSGNYDNGIEVVSQEDVGNTANITGGTLWKWFINSDTTLPSVSIDGATGAAVYNEQGHADGDFRIEGDTETNLFLTDASADAAYLGGSTNGLKVAKGGVVTFEGTAGFSGSIISTLATGTKPLTIASTTLCDNLNADLLDGHEAAYFATADHTHAAGDADTVDSIHAATTATANKLLALDADKDLHLDTGDISGVDANMSGSVTLDGTLTIDTAVSGILAAASGVVGVVTPEAKASHNNWAALSDVVAALVALGLFDAA